MDDNPARDKDLAARHTAKKIGRRFASPRAREAARGPRPLCGRRERSTRGARQSSTGTTREGPVMLACCAAARRGARGRSPHSRAQIFIAFMQQQHFFQQQQQQQFAAQQQQAHHQHAGARGSSTNLPDAAASERGWNTNAPTFTPGGGGPGGGGGGGGASGGGGESGGGGGAAARGARAGACAPG